MGLMGHLGHMGHMATDGVFTYLLWGRGYFHVIENTHVRWPGNAGLIPHGAVRRRGLPFMHWFTQVWVKTGAYYALPEALPALLPPAATSSERKRVR